LLTIEEVHRCGIKKKEKLLQVKGAKGVVYDLETLLAQWKDDKKTEKRRDSLSLAKEASPRKK